MIFATIPRELQIVLPVELIIIAHAANGKKERTYKVELCGQTAKDRKTIR